MKKETMQDDKKAAISKTAVQDTEDINIKELFCSKNIKYTKQRELALKFLSICKEPVSAEQIYVEMKNTNISLSLSTVYRILDVFVEKGIVTKEKGFADEQRALYAIFEDVHKHRIVCEKCRRMVELEECPFKNFEKELESKTNFIIKKHKLEISGVCPECRQSEEELRIKKSEE